MKWFVSLIFGCILFVSNSFAAGSGDVVLKRKDWSFSGPFGTLDKSAMQRGFQAYRGYVRPVTHSIILLFVIFQILVIVRQKLKHSRQNTK